VEHCTVRVHRGSCASCCCVRFGVLTAATKNLLGSGHIQLSRSFGGTFSLHLHGRSVSQTSKDAEHVSGKVVPMLN
jgi:hypothetical protein